MKNVLLTGVLALVLAGCGDSVKQNEAIDAAGGRPVSSEGGYSDTRVDGAVVGTINGSGNVSGTELVEGLKVSYEKGAINDPGNILSKRIIYFDFDSDDVSDEFLELIKHHGKYLALNPEARVRLEGHADERGTREYNIALAERRALAVKTLLQYEAVADQQMKVISYGEEKPVTFGLDEESMQLNRRVEIVYE